MFAPPEIPSPPGKEEAARDRAVVTQSRRATDRRGVAGVTGLRGLAVLGVIAFQAGLLAGGHLAVELFFVVTGFTITNLLIAEDRRNGRINVVSFAANSLRRLVPGLLAMVISVAAAVALLEPSLLGRVRVDAIAGVLHVANWTSIAAVGNEVSSLVPFDQRSPLSHLWAPAIEAQFTLGWTLTVVLLLSVMTRRPAVVLLAALGGAGASAAVQLAAVDGAFDRWYFGTDTRSVALFAGAALAAIVDPGRREGLLRHDTFVGVDGDASPVRPSDRDRMPLPEARAAGARPVNSRLLLELAGTAGGLFLLVAWTRLPRAVGLEPEGLLLVGAFAACALLAAVIHPSRGSLHRVFATGPLHWLGQISYGLYLWHWPISVLINADRVDLEGPALAAVRLLVTILAAMTSLHVVEIPVRERQLPLTRQSSDRVVEGPLGGLLGLVAFIVVVLGLAMVPGDALGVHPPVAADAPPSLALQNTRTRPEIILIGDSIFGELSEGVERASDDFRVLDETIEYCGLVDVAASRIGEDSIVEPDEDCRDSRRRWRAVVAESQPALVLISASRWDATWKRLGDDEFVTPCSEEMRERAEQFVTGTAAMFAGGDTTVALVTMPDVRTDELGTFTDCANNVYRSIAAANPDVEIFDTDRLLCPDHDCARALDPERPLIEGYHLTEAGETEIGAWLLEQYDLIADG